MGGRRQSDKSNKSDPERTGATEPITLMDPDGAVTRVAPWSTWSREQVRAPGGEPSLVTRLDQGQLWFAAGRRQSPWRHEVVVGPATVSTPRGRFHVTAETDGGATIACLAGRTRVVAGLSEPVVLTANQTAAVSSDGATLVVMDRGSGDGAGVLGDAWDDGQDPFPEAAAPAVPVAQAYDLPVEEPDGAAPVVAMAAGNGGSGGGGDDGIDGSDDGAGPQPRWRRIPEFIAIAALLGVLIAAVIVFGSGSDSSEIVDSSGPSSTIGTPTTKTTTSTSTTTTTTPTTTSTSAPTTSTTAVTTPSTIVVPGAATGSLAGCRRAAGGVQATVAVTHRSGGPGRFLVRVGLVDSAGTLFARGEANTSLIDPGGNASVDVLIRLDGAAQGSCELLEVVPA